MTSKPRTERIYPEGKWTELLAAIGNNEEIATLIKDAGYDPPPPGSIQGWRTRGSVPARWTPLFLEWALAKQLVRRPLELLREPI
jgi:hypothetical protein